MINIKKNVVYFTFSITVYLLIFFSKNIMVIVLSLYLLDFLGLV